MERVNKVNRIFKDPIARRYFVMNTFDGVLTVMGLVLGGALTIADPLTVFKTGLGASLAIMISGFFGAYMAEKAEQTASIKKLERQLLHKLDGTTVHEKAKAKVLMLALVDGFSPFFGSFLPILPFLFAHLGFLSFGLAFASSIVIAFILLIFLGIFLGKIMEESPWKMGFFFVLGGVLIGVLGSLIEKLL